MIKKIKTILPLFFLILFYLLFVFFTYKDYGITWDEWDVYRRGRYLLIHITKEDSLLLIKTPNQVNNIDRGDIFYNHFYSAFLNLLNPQFKYEKFHLFNMLLGIIIIVTAYFLMYKI